MTEEVAEQTPPTQVEPAEGSDEVAPPTEDSPQPAEATGEGESTEEPAEGASEGEPQASQA